MLPLANSWLQPNACRTVWKSAKHVQSQDRLPVSSIAKITLFALPRWAFQVSDRGDIW